MQRRNPLTFEEKKAIFVGKMNGITLTELAAEVGCSHACARKWWRIGKRGGLEALRPQPRQMNKGCLSRFDPRVAQQALYWKGKHPRRGPDRILNDLATDPLVATTRLPHRSSLALYFKRHCPELLQRAQPGKAPPKARRVHEIWQIDAKEKITLRDETVATVLTIREPVACVFLGCYAHDVTRGGSWSKLSLRQIQDSLRRVFERYGLPHGLQTDRERVYGHPPETEFPSLFTLWLAGLGIRHHFKRPSQTTDQAHVERSHRTWNDFLASPEVPEDLRDFQQQLNWSTWVHNTVLGSRAGDCGGGIPLEVHPEAQVALRPYERAAESLLYDQGRVERFLAQYSWSHQVSVSGQVSVGRTNYYVGVAHKGRRVSVTFDAADRHFVFTDVQTGSVLRRRVGKGLEIEDIAGIARDPSPRLTMPLQLEIPF